MCNLYNITDIYVIMNDSKQSNLDLEHSEPK